LTTFGLRKSERLATVVFWTSGPLRCDFVISGPPEKHEVQITRHGVVVLHHPCEDSAAAVDLAALLWARFADCRDSPTWGDD